MSVSTINHPGPPIAADGLYLVDDEVTDSQGVTWSCTVSGQPGSWVSGESTLVAPVVLGTGDEVHVFVATTGARQGVSLGTAGTPDTGINPAVKVNRTINLTSGGVTGDGGEQAAALTAVGTGVVANQVQVVGIRSGATAPASATSDVCAEYGTGINAGSGVAIGATFVGRATGTGKPSGAQISSYNGTGSDQSVVAAGFSGGALWITANGANKSGAAIEVGNPNSIKFDVGLHFNSQNTGAVATASIQDDSQSATALLINGTHATAAIQVASGSGHIGLGIAAAAGVYINAQADADASIGFRLRRHSNTASADILEVTDELGTTNYLKVGPTGNVFVCASGGSISFFGGSAVTKQTSAGNTHTVAAGSTTGVFTNTTFDGGTGVTAYTIGDIVLALKNYNLLTA